jgi:hypothetical protein
MAIITVEQARKEYFKGCISMSKLYDMIRKKEIPVLQISSRKHYFDTNALDRWVDNGCIIQTQDVNYGKLRRLKA